VKGYQSGRVVQTFDPIGSRRDLLRALAIGLPALTLAAVGASAKQGTPVVNGDEPAAALGRAPADSSVRESGR
jgi:hypothetical protein